MIERITNLPTLRIEPNKPISIKYGKQTILGVEGDTVATALFGSGIRVFSRSLKYHRPRGLYSLDGESANTLMEVDGVPNERAETTFIREGMKVKPLNVKGNPKRDWMSFMRHLGWAMPAGFYYRTMHKPASLWPKAIKIIRKAAGIGKIAHDYQMRGRYEETYPNTDVCVIGGGPAGMKAAMSAAEQGLRVIILESRPWLGGFFEYRASLFEKEKTLFERAHELADQVMAHENIRVFINTPAVGLYQPSLVTAFQRGGPEDHFDQRYVEIRAKSVVTATGCIERPLIFENNELPGIMQVGCAHRLARTWGLFPGNTAVLSISNDLGLEVATELATMGMNIQAVADVREDGQDPKLLENLTNSNIRLFRGWVAYKAHGYPTLKKVTLSHMSGNHRRDFKCDTLVASAGLSPVIGPLTLAGTKLVYDSHTGYFLPESLPEGLHAAGRMLGFNDPKTIEISGHVAGLRAAMNCGINARNDLTAMEDILKSLPNPDQGSKCVTAPVSGHKAFICFDEDTTIKNVNQSMDMGFDVPELIKRFSAAGTGPGQGGISGHNLPLYVSQTGDSPDLDPKPTTVRPPLVPTLLATYAGSNHDMAKRTAVHHLQVSAGAQMERVGVWHRARRFSDDLNALDEIVNVRKNVGILDASTLGKFRIYGPDAQKVLDRVYVGDMSKVSQDRLKYSAMCNEDGCLIDDGVVIKRGENDYYFTSSTARAGMTVEWIRYHTRFDNWNFHIVNLTDAFGVINLAGPKAREVLQTATTEDLSNKGFPFMGYREFDIKDSIPVRAMRLGFVGELSYELHIPASYMQSVWEILLEAGKPAGIRPFGLEAQSTLRMEKGHVIIGSESEQRTTLHDLRLGFLWHRNKPEAKTVGAFALKQTEHQKNRLKLVGFRMEEPPDRPPKDGSPIVDSRIRGYVCTARFSQALGKPVGMALVDDELAIPGKQLDIYEDGCNGHLIHAVVEKMPFYDPEGKRMRM